MRKCSTMMSIVVFVLFVVLFVSCERKDDVCYNFAKEEVVSIPLANITSPFSRLQYCKIDGKEMVVANLENHELTFFDIAEKKQSHTINLLKDRELRAFEYVNKDSIFMLYTMPYSYYRSGVSDSVILSDTLSFQLIDYNGNVKKYYHFNCDDSNFNGSNITVGDVLPPYSGLFYHKIMRSGNMVFFYPSKYLYNDVENISNSKPFIACYDLNTEKYYFTKHKLPYLNDTAYYPVLEGSSNFMYFCISPDGLPVLRFSYSSDVFEWDYKNDVLIPHTLKSRIIDTIAPLKYRTNSLNSMDAYYHRITYDYNKEMYYSSILFPMKDELLSATIIADKNFNYICEIQKGCGDFPQFVQDKIISCYVVQDSISVIKSILRSVDKNSCFVDSMRNIIDSIRYEKKHNLLQYVIEGHNPLQNFFEQNVPDHESNYCILTLYTNGGCSSCKQFMLSLIAENQKILSEVPLYLIMSGSESTIENELNLNGVVFDDFKNVIYDKEAIVESLPLRTSFLNPRLTIVRNDKVVLDSVYNAQGIEKELIPTMLEACGLRMDVR